MTSIPFRIHGATLAFFAVLMGCLYSSAPQGRSVAFAAEVAARAPRGDRAESKIESDDPSEASGAQVTVSLPRAKWKSAGIQIGKPTEQEFSERIRLTGKISLNEDRISHVYPMVEGTVDRVAISLGEVVEEDQLLTVVHSREVGKAKLELFQARLQSEMAEVKDKLQRELSANTSELLTALREQRDITEIQEQHKDSNMGEYRERLLSAYADYLKSQADVNRLEGISTSGAVSGKQLLAARTRRNAGLATFQARIEQIAYELETSQLETAQAVKEANTRVAVATTNLRILGCEESEIKSIDPMRQGEAISHYSIRAPFRGTVIAKDVTLGEQVRPDKQILTIADLTTVWIKADIYEKDVPLLASLDGTEFQFVSEAWPGKSFTAKVFYTGEIMDEATRTVSMRAVAENGEHLLKPGMFVTIQLPAKSEQVVVQIPAAAVQQHEGKQFVFVHVGDDQFERRDIQVGRSDRDWAVVERGVRGNESVVTGGGFILKSKLLEGLLAEE
ncbi:efflux RND transporter periplasmic adaptor subunit [Roseiconus nitratireducens]|nr:efflux RND transporter periplasmic adaptor subunit [Roseiconus nitratireducens]